MLAKAAIGSGWIAASVPPASTTSARPRRIRSMAIAIASLPDAQAEVGCVDGRAGAVLEADVGRRRVGHEHRDGQRRDATRALLEERVVVGEQRGDAADAGGERHAEALGLEAGVLQAGVGPGLVGRDHGELAGAVEAAGLDAVEDLGRLDGDAAAILTGSWSTQSSVEVADAGLPGEQGVPGGGDVTADGGGGAESGDDYAGRAHVVCPFSWRMALR